MMQTFITTNVPYPLIWDRGRLDVHIAGKNFIVEFQRLYPQGSNNVEVKYDRSGNVAWTGIVIRFPVHIQNQEDLQGWIHLIINRVLEVYRFTTGEFYVNTIPRDELGDWEVRDVADDGTVSDEISHHFTFGGPSLSIARHMPISDEARNILSSGTEVPIYRIMYLNAKREELLENFRLAVVEAETAFEVLVDEVVSRYYRGQGASTVEVENKLEAGLTNLVKDHIPICCDAPFVGTDVHKLWIEDLYTVRNRVIHDGASITADQAEKAVEAGGEALEWLTTHAI